MNLHFIMVRKRSESTVHTLCISCDHIITEISPLGYADFVITYSSMYNL